MKVVIYSPGRDTAGLGIALKRAFDRYGGEWEARAVRGRPSKWDYPVDIEWTASRNEEVLALFSAADVVHIMERPADLPAYRGKPIVVQHLGTFYRRNPDGVDAACRQIGALQVTSGHDLLLKPGLGWLPTTIDLEGIAALRKGYRPRKRVRIAHAPTSREFKSTERIIAAVEKVQARHHITFDLIEDTPWQECLARKALADIYIDELNLGYGINALECWAMGIPVVSGLTDARARRFMLDDYGQLPFLDATTDTIDAIIERLVVEPLLRHEWGSIGRSHVTRFHGPQQTVQLAIGYYHQAMAGTPGLAGPS